MLRFVKRRVSAGDFPVSITHWHLKRKTWISSKFCESTLFYSSFS